MSRSGSRPEPLSSEPAESDKYERDRRCRCRRYRPKAPERIPTMSRQDRPGGPLASFRRRPTFEPMEGRMLLAAAPASPQFFAASAAQVQSDYHAFVTQLQTMELRSHATPEQYRALRDDARAISAAA